MRIVSILRLALMVCCLLVLDGSPSADAALLLSILQETDYVLIS